MADMLKSRSGQLQHRNLRPCALADGKTDRANATVDVDLAAGFFVPSAEIAVIPTAECEASVGELERQLAAVGVPGQGKVDAQLGGAIKAVGIVTEKNVGRVRHHQTLDSSQVRTLWPIRTVVVTLEVHAKCYFGVLRFTVEFLTCNFTCTNTVLQVLRRTKAFSNASQVVRSI